MRSSRFALTSLFLAPIALLTACVGSVDPEDGAAQGDNPADTKEATLTTASASEVSTSHLTTVTTVATVDRPIITVVNPGGIQLATPSLITFDTVANGTNLSQTAPYDAQGVFFFTVTGAPANGCGTSPANFVGTGGGAYAVLDPALANGGAAAPPCAAGFSGAWCAPAPDKNVVSIGPNQTLFSGSPANAPANQGPTEQILVEFLTARSWVSISALAVNEAETLGGTAPNGVYLAAYDRNYNCLGEVVNTPAGQWEQLAFSAPVAGTISFVVLSTEYTNAQNPVFAEFDNLQYL